MREKPEHQAFTFGNKHSNHNTHRCFYIDGRCVFAFLVGTETDLNVILDAFLREKDFLSLKEYSSPDWDHIGLLDYFPETNEVFLTTNNKTKNLILQDVSTATLAKAAKKLLEAERKIAEEADYQRRLAEEEKRKAAEFEKEQKRLAKLQKKANKEKKGISAKALADLEEGVSVTAGGTIEQFEAKVEAQKEDPKEEKIIQKTVSKKGIRSLI